MSRLNGLLSREGGFTLIELLTAISIGAIVITAALTVLDRSMVLSNEVADRTDALQRGRQTMELLTRQLRSQVCLGTATEPITDGRKNSVEFYADMTDGADPNKIEKRRLTWDPATKKFTEARYTPSGAYPDLVYSATPAKMRVIGSPAKPLKDGTTDRAIFRYFRFKEGTTTGELQEVIPNTGADPSDPALNPVDVPSIVMIQVAFVSQTTRASAQDAQATTLDNQVYVRSADPMQPEEGVRCL